jgi:chorismate-pyruvate lyase
MQPIWKQPQSYSQTQLPSSVRQWLLFPDSMTQRLQCLTSSLGLKIRIQVLWESLELTHDLAIEPNLFDCRYVYTRRIHMYADHVLLLYAHSAVPKNAPCLFKQQFRRLGRRPLGEILHKKPALLGRSAFELAQIPPQQGEYQLTCMEEVPCPEFVWGRRSYFYDTAPVLWLAEYFSPHFLKMITNAYEPITADN